MQKDLRKFKWLKTFFHLVGMPLFALCCWIWTMPFLGETVYGSSKYSAIIIVLAMWAAIEALRLVLKFVSQGSAKKRKGKPTKARSNVAIRNGIIVAIFAFLVMFVPVYLMDASYEKTTNEANEEYITLVNEMYTPYAQEKAKAAGDENWEEVTYDAGAQSYRYQAGWFRSISHGGSDDVVSKLSETAADFLDFYDPIMKKTPHGISWEDGTYGGFGFPVATEAQLKAGNHLYVYFDKAADSNGTYANTIEFTSGSISDVFSWYEKYDKENPVHEGKVVFYSDMSTEKPLANTKDTTEAYSLGNKDFARMFALENGRYVAYKGNSYSALVEGGTKLYKFTEKFEKTDMWGDELFWGMKYGYDKVLEKEINLLEGYVKTYRDELAKDTPNVTEEMEENYLTAMKGNDEHWSLEGLYSFRSRMSYQPDMYPFFPVRYFTFIFLGIVALSMLAVGYYEQRILNVKDARAQLIAEKKAEKAAANGEEYTAPAAAVKTPRKAKGLFLLFDILLYLVGFPLLIVLLWLNARHGIENSYSFGGIGMWAPVILGGLMMIICLIVEIILRSGSKKSIKQKGKSSMAKQGMKLGLAAMCCLTGLFIVLDIALPGILVDATDDTIQYESFVEDYDAMHDKFTGLIDEFIIRNVNNGHLAGGFKDQNIALPADDESLSQEQNDKNRIEWIKENVTAEELEKAQVYYTKDGINNKEVYDILKLKFTSIDSAYGRFQSLGISMALAGMDLGANLDLVLDLLILPGFLPNEAFVVDDGWGYQYSVLDLLGEVPEGIDLGDIDLDLGAMLHVHTYGTLDYMSQAWLNSVELLGVITSLFSARLYFYIFGAVIFILSMLRAMCRQRYSKNLKADYGEEDAKDGNGEAEAVAYDEGATYDPNAAYGGGYDPNAAYGGGYDPNQAYYGGYAQPDPYYGGSQQGGNYYG